MEALEDYVTHHIGMQYPCHLFWYYCYDYYRGTNTDNNYIDINFCSLNIQKYT
jgi:hypothetical protein